MIDRIQPSRLAKFLELTDAQGLTKGGAAEPRCNRRPEKGPGFLRGPYAFLKPCYLPAPDPAPPPLVRPSAAAGELAPAAFVPLVEVALLPFSEPTVRGATEVPVVGLSTATPVLVVSGVCTPVPAEFGCGAFWFAPACAKAVPIERARMPAARMGVRMFRSC
jgi:hypothetical protein